MISLICTIKKIIFPFQIIIEKKNQPKKKFEGDWAKKKKQKHLLMKREVYIYLEIQTSLQHIRQKLHFM